MMPGGGIVAIAAISEASPATVVVAYTARSDRGTHERLLAGGAAAVFTKGEPVDLAGELEELVAARRSC
jgi:DNA-binding NarL/FixJ family response regulator